MVCLTGHIAVTCNDARHVSAMPKEIEGLSLHGLHLYLDIVYTDLTDAMMVLRFLSDDEAHLMKLPDPFAVADVETVWGVKQRRAYKVLERLTKDRLAEKDKGSPGKYRILRKGTVQFVQSVQKLSEKLHRLHELHTASPKSPPKVFTNDYNPEAPASLETDAPF